MMLRFLAFGTALLTLALPFFAHAEGGKPLSYIEYGTAVAGMSEKEAKGLKSIWDDHQIIDLERSGFSEIQSWFERVNERLTGAIEKQGNSFSTYRIYLTASPKADAFIYKSQVAGQKMLRGNVFLSVGMLGDLLKNAGADLNHPTAAQIDQLLKDIQGILSHEFAHPKEDELVKWDWRSAQGKSRQNHSQADEMATDMLALRTLKEAKLDPRNLLSGLEHVFGNAPDNNSLANRAVTASNSSHPEESLRVNLVRGGLTKLRLDEGAPDVKPIDYSPDRMSQDLKNILVFKIADNRLEMEIRKKPGSPFSNALRTLQEELQKPRERTSSFDPWACLLDHYRVLEAVQPPGLKLTEREMKDFTQHIEYLVTSGRFEIKRKSGHFGGWMRWESRSGNNVGLMPPVNKSRAVLRQIDRIEAFSDPRFLRWSEEKLNSGVIGFLVKSDRKNGMASFESAAGIFSRKQSEGIFIKTLPELEKLAPQLEMEHLLRLWYGVTLAASPPDLEARVVKRISFLIRTSPEAYSVFLTDHSNVTEEATQLIPEKMARYAKSHPDGARLLTAAMADMYTAIMESPERAVAYISASGEDLDSGFMFWNSQDHPKRLLTRFDEKHQADGSHVSRRLEAILGSPKWQEYLASQLDPHLGDETVRWDELPAARLASVILPNNSPFTAEQRIGVISKLLALDTQPTKLENFDYYAGILSAINGKKANGAVDLLRRLSQHAGKSPEVLLRDLDWQGKLFRDGPSRFIAMIAESRTQKLISQDVADRLVTKVTLSAGEHNLNALLPKLEKDAVLILARVLRSQGIEGIELVRKLSSQLEVARYDSVTFPKGSDSVQKDIQQAITAQVKVLPSVTNLFEFLSGPLLSDLRKMAELGRLSPKDPLYIKAFARNFEKIENMYSAIFNPGGEGVPVQLKGLVSYQSLDNVAASFSELIPPSGLTPDQYYRLWRNMASKRANRYTDALFEKHVLPNVGKISLINMDALAKESLEYGLVRSQRYKSFFLERALEPRLRELEVNRGKLPDAKVASLVDQVNRLVPESSRFRDQFVEDLSWRLQLGEKQAAKFIEPMKSFNFKALDTHTLNALSLLSVFIAKMPTKEKISFLKYVIEPRGELVRAVPSMKKAKSDAMSYFAENFNVYMEEHEYREMLDKLESFIRDASESERLILNEMIVGSRRTGLWHQGESMKRTLFELAGFSPEKVTYFESYVAALPEHERSMAMSYLLAMKGGEAADASESQLLSMLELHKTAGIKFAQIASVLQTFDAEESAKLAKAKNRSSPLSLAEAYEELRRVYSPELYEKYKPKIIGRAGSGGIKHVLFVEFADGATEAVYLKRKYLKETVEDTLNIVTKFTKNLRQHPEYANTYDYDYYLSTLREQLAEESQFLRELKVSTEMGKLYREAPSVSGWGFKEVPPSKLRIQTEDVLHFEAIQGSLPFEKLSAADQKAVSELILRTELKLLLQEGHFDADPHLGNYLFDPKTKRVYRIDFGQTYALEKGSILKPGDRVQLARILRAMVAEDKIAASKELADVFLAVAENVTKIPAATRARIEARLGKILSESPNSAGKIVALLGELTRENVHLPLRYSLGIFKGMTLIAYEKYAQKAPPGLIEGVIRGFVRKTLIRDAIASPLRRCLGPFLETLQSAR